MQFWLNFEKIVMIMLPMVDRQFLIAQMPVYWMAKEANFYEKHN
jgi:hypothetical protein